MTGDQLIEAGDELVEKGAERLQELSQKAAARGGYGETLAQTLAEDAVFLRQLKPSLVAARLRGEAPTDQRPEEDVVVPSAPQSGSRPNPFANGGVNPLVVVGAALVAGIFLAKLIDWRSHAHPRD